MKKKNENKNIITARSYITTLVIVIGIIFLCTYFFNSYQSYLREKNKTSYLSRTIGEVKYKEINKVLLETSDDYFIYVSYINQDEILNLEKDLKKIIVKYNLESSMYFLNVTDLYQNPNFYEELNTTLGIKDNKIIKVPAIVYYKDKKVVSVLSSTDVKIITAKDFENLLKENNINKK